MNKDHFHKNYYSIQLLALYYAAGLCVKRDLKIAKALRKAAIQYFLKSAETTNTVSKKSAKSMKFFENAAILGSKQARAILSKQNSHEFGNNFTQALSQIESGQSFAVDIWDMYECGSLTDTEFRTLTVHALFSESMHSDALILFLSKSWINESTTEYSLRYMSLLELACKLQNGIAYYLLGLEYLSEERLEKNSSKAVELFYLSAQTGFYKGMYVHGIHLIESAEGTSAQIEEGLTFIKKAADIGYDLAQDWLIAHNEKAKGQ